MIDHGLWRAGVLLSRPGLRVRLVRGPILSSMMLRVRLRLTMTLPAGSGPLLRPACIIVLLRCIKVTILPAFTILYPPAGGQATLLITIVAAFLAMIILLAAKGVVTVIQPVPVKVCFGLLPVTGWPGTLTRNMPTVTYTTRGAPDKVARWSAIKNLCSYTLNR